MFEEIPTPPLVIRLAMPEDIAVIDTNPWASC